MRGELEETKNKLVNCETQLQQTLEPVSPPVVVVCEPENPTPEPESENTESPAVKKPSTKPNLDDDDDDDDGTISRGELIDYIRQNYPDAKINPQNLTDAVNGKSKRMPEYEKAYGFKYAGKKAGQHRFMLLNKS